MNDPDRNTVIETGGGGGGVATVAIVVILVLALLVFLFFVLGGASIFGTRDNTVNPGVVVTPDTGIPGGGLPTVAPPAGQPAPPGG